MPRPLKPIERNWYVPPTPVEAEDRKVLRRARRIGLVLAVLVAAIAVAALLY